MCPKTIARQTVRYAKENRDKNQTQNPEMKPNYQKYSYIPGPSVRHYDRERERSLSSSEPAANRTPNGLNFAGPQTKKETHLTLPLSGSDQSPSDAQIRTGSERGFVSISFFLEPTYRQGRLSSLRYPACNVNAPYYSVNYRLSGPTIFFHTSHKRHNFRKKKVIQHKMCVLIFFTNFVGNDSHCKKNWERYDRKFISVFM